MMMIQRSRTSSQVSMAKPAHRKSVEPVDHWAFLDEIEAPMWADLNLEVTSCYKDNDDNWFHMSHPFHQCSSRKLKSAFSHVGEVKTHVSSSLKGSSSPNLPPSVSRSRGKDFKNKKWIKGDSVIIAHKQHPIKNLNGKSSWVSSGSDKKLNNKPIDGNRKESGRTKATSVCESNLTENTRLNSSNSTAETRESKTTSNLSTVTYESSEKQGVKFSEVSNHDLGQTSGILLALKLNFNKNCVTRQALRVDSVGGRKLGGRKSSSGKSSVGSSSYPGYDAGKIAGGPILKSKDATPESKNMKKMVLSNLDRVKGLAASKKSADTRLRSRTVTSKSSYVEAAKSKVVNPKVIRLRRGNEPLAAVTKMETNTKIRKYNRLENGKENAKIKTIAGAGEIVQVQKFKKPTAPSKTEKPGLIGPKMKICSRDEKKSTTMIRNIHFR